MSYFPRILNRSGIYRHDGRPLWAYHLTEREFQELISEIKNSTRSNLDGRDCALFYAEWWKRMYNGGTPSKELIFQSINIGVLHSPINAEDFYKLAREGGYRLKYKWIKSANTLFFRTLLLNGGLPLKHMRNNRTNYETFLSEILELQPSSLQDVIEATHTHQYLPKSSQNEYIFSSCYDVVSALLSGSKKYDTIFKDDDVLGEILSNLKEKARKVESKKSLNKSKLNWYLTLSDEGIASLSFELLLINEYSAEDLKVLLQVDEISSSNYYLMIEDELAYKISKTKSGRYKTFPLITTSTINDLENAPLFTITGGEESKPLPHLLSYIPKLDQPSLWIKQDEGVYRYSRAPFTSENSASIIYPSERMQKSINILGDEYELKTVQGEVELNFKDKSWLFSCGVEAFEWNINEYYPECIQSSNEKLISETLSLDVFDTDGNRISPTEYRISVKGRGTQSWKSIESYHPPLGFIDVKIEYKGVAARDEVFNLGKVHFKPNKTELQESSLSIIGLSQFTVEGISNEITNIDVRGSEILFTNLVPDKREFSGMLKIKVKNQKHCKLKIDIPFEGIEILAPDKSIISNSSKLCFNRLQGYRLSTNKNKVISVTLFNNLRKAIRIKKASGHLFSLIGLFDDIKLLYELGDPMNKSNFVIAEFKYDSNLQKRINFMPTTGNIPINDNQEITLDDTLGAARFSAVPTRVFHDAIEDIILEPQNNLIPLNNLEGFEEIIISAETDHSNILLRPRKIRFKDPSNFNPGFSEYQNQLFTGGLEDESWKIISGYLQYCIDFDLPFSSFDQIKMLRQAPEVAVVLTLKTLINQDDPIEYISTHLKRLESDLGINLYCISSQTWRNGVLKVSNFLLEKHNDPCLPVLSKLVGMYFEHAGLDSLKQFIIHGAKPNMNGGVINNADLTSIRSSLGTRVLKELPRNNFDCKGSYGIPKNNHKQIAILIDAGISVAEEIGGKALNLFGNSEEQAAMRRNIQYCKQIAPNFFERVLIQTLNRL